MKRNTSRAWSVFLSLLMAMNVSIPNFAADQNTLEAACTDTAAYVYQTVTEPRVV